MTWSILGRDPSGRLGVAVASRFFAVGALCPHTRRGVGAVSSQALLNPLYGPAALQLLSEGQTLFDGARALTDGDPGRQQRQLHILPARGKPIAFTGERCVEWCGHLLDDDFSVAGNMLAGPQVIEASAAAYRDAHALPLAERLLAALEAGDAAGGDKRGKQAAALVIQGDEDRRELDLRVDDHVEPIVELRRLYDVSLERFQPFVSCLAGRHSAGGLIDRDEIEARIAAFHTSRSSPR